jgi:Tol biopolymer transport system component
MSLMILPARGGTPELLHEASDLDALLWRPDNRTVVYQTGSTLNEIDVATRRIRQLVSATKRVWGVSISPDNRMVYTDWWHYQFLFEVDVETGARRQITWHAKDNGGARFSPDGRTIGPETRRSGCTTSTGARRPGSPTTTSVTPSRTGPPTASVSSSSPNPKKEFSGCS